MVRQTLKAPRSTGKRPENWRSFTVGRGLQRALLVGLLLVLAGNAAARGPWRASAGNTRGWELMTPEERIEHQARIRGFTTLETCRAYQREHHQLMVERARQRGLTLPSGGRDFCAHLDPQGAGQQ